MTDYLLIATIAGEAEPVVLNVDDPTVVELVLDDGHKIQINRAELEEALAWGKRAA